MIFYGKTFAEKQRERKGRDYDRDMRSQRNNTIEECAMAVMGAYWIAYDYAVREKFAAAIRLLKDKP